MTTGQRWTLITLGAALLAFGLGAGWQLLRATRLESSLATSERELELRRIENTLALATLEAQRGRYEDARHLTSSFFSEFQASTEQWPPEARGAFNQILATRDSSITALSRSDPGAAALLEQLWVKYRVALGEPVAADEVPKPAAPAEADSGPALLPLDTAPEPVPLDTTI